MQILVKKVRIGIFLVLIVVIDAFGIDHYFTQKCRVDSLEVLQDPFFPELIEVKQNHLLLQAIVLNRVKINDKWYALYDDIEGFKISQISNLEVVLVNDDKKMVLKLYEESNKIFIY